MLKVLSIEFISTQRLRVHWFYYGCVKVEPILQTDRCDQRKFGPNFLKIRFVIKIVLSLKQRPMMKSKSTSAPNLSTCVFGIRVSYYQTT